jgi:hypothetical protein
MRRIISIIVVLFLSTAASAQVMTPAVNSPLPVGSNSAQGILQADGSGICVTAGIVGLCNPYPVGANPSASVGVSAVNGSATSFMRSDAAPALAANGVTNSILAQMTAGSVKCNPTGATANAQDCNTLATMLANATLLPNFTLSNIFGGDEFAGYLTFLKSMGFQGVITDGHTQLGNVLAQGWLNAAYRSAGDISFYSDGTPSGSILPGKIYLNTTNAAPLDTWLEYDHAGHLNNVTKWTGTVNTSPVLSACGTTPNIRTGSTDTIGAFTQGTTPNSGCTLTFTTAFRATPFCQVTFNAVPPTTFTLTLSITALTITTTANYFAETTYQCWDSGSAGN